MTLLDGRPTKPAASPYRNGESLTFTATWTAMSVGEATFTADTGGRLDGKPAIHLTASAKTGRAFSLVFPIDDAGESWIDPEELYSLGFVTDQKEGTIEDHRRWSLDNERHVATLRRTRRKGSGEPTSSTKEYALPRTHVQDPISMAYFFRAFPLKAGSTLEAEVFLGQIWTLRIEVVSEETIKVPAGTFACLKLKPSISLSGEPLNKGELFVWITNDDRKMPVKIQSDLPLGKVNAVLTKFTEGKREP